MNKMKTFIQCGWEDSCLHKDCLNCPRKRKHNLNLTLAEEICIEDFAMCDLESMINGGEYSKGLRFPDKKAEVELMQNIMRKLMKKVFKADDPKEKNLLSKIKKSLKDVKSGRIKRIK